MANVPDIDPSKTSFLAYYNLQDSELSGNFIPSELNFGTDMFTRFSTGPGTVYDNGYEFTIDDNLMNSTINIRAGNDSHKWITAHIKNYQNGGDFTGAGDDVSSYSRGSTTGGEYDIMPWKNATVYKPTENSLFAAIKKSLSNTDYWTRSELNISNAGLYDYSTPDESQQISIFSGGIARTTGLAFTDTTTIHKAYISGFANVTGTTDRSKFLINETECFRVDGGGSMRFALNVTSLLSKVDELDLSLTRYNFDESGSYFLIVVWS